MKHHPTRTQAILTPALALALAVGLTLSLAGCGRTQEKPTTTPTAAADPTAQALADDLGALAGSIGAGLDLDAIADDLDAPLPTGATADVSPLLTEAASMAKDLATAIPTVAAVE
jgi:hypothetical protein